MDTESAIMMGQANRGRPPKVFDWNKAAKLIALNSPKVARAGLAWDWENTGGDIWRDGKPVPRDETYTYLASTWATPELEMDGETQPCFKSQEDTDGWHSGTYWPESALAIVAKPGNA